MILEDGMGLEDGNGSEAEVDEKPEGNRDDRKSYKSSRRGRGHGN